MADKTVLQIINDVAESMGDNYCKYPLLYEKIYGSCGDEANNRLMDEVCENCPLSKLA